MNNDLSFDGKMIMLGRFQTIFSYKTYNTQSKIVNSSIKFSTFWRHFISFSLIENMRLLPEETEFAKFLLIMGDGILNDSNDNIELSDYCIAPIDVNIVEDIYNNLIRNKKFNNISKCTILFIRNVDVDEINNKLSNY